MMIAGQLKEKKVSTSYKLVILQQYLTRKYTELE